MAERYYGPLLQELYRQHSSLPKTRTATSFLAELCLNFVGLFVGVCASTALTVL
jgi:hypothetical protein